MIRRCMDCGDEKWEPGPGMVTTGICPHCLPTRLEEVKKMKIKEITSQSRRDFSAVYHCEHCGHEKRGSGYDDANFHQNVIPAMKCEECGKAASEGYRPLATKYPAGMVV